METLAGRIGSARWKVETAHGTLSENGKLNAKPFGSKGDVIFEPTTGRHRAHLQSIVPAVGGPEPSLAQRNLCTFDGTRSRIFNRHSFGRTIPAIQGGGAGTLPGFGSVWDNTDEFQKLWGWQSGVGYFPPYFEKDRLPDLLRRERSKGRLARVTEDDQGIWHIEVIDDANAKSLKRIDYDRSKGGVVTGAVWKNGEPPKAWKQITVELQHIDGSYWVPKMVENRFILDKPVSVDYVFFRDVRLNRPVSDSDFQLQFPTGSQVMDYAEKKAYVIGGKPKDEQAMIRGFMQMTGMRPSPPPPPPLEALPPLRRPHRGRPVGLILPGAAVAAPAGCGRSPNIPRRHGRFLDSPGRRPLRTGRAEKKGPGSGSPFNPVWLPGDGLLLGDFRHRV
jgi:hypothetical protein